MISNYQHTVKSMLAIHVEHNQNEETDRQTDKTVNQTADKDGENS